MGENLDWYHRVHEMLHEEDTYDEKGYELFEGLQEFAAFRKGLGEKHPTIELYDMDDEERIAHVCFDPANQQFYFPIYDEDVDKKFNLLLESFEDILTMFIGAWKNYIDMLNDDLDDLDYDEEGGGLSDFLMGGEGKHLLQHHLSAFMMQKDHEEKQKEKVEKIKWLEEEQLIESVKVDIPVPSERQVILKLGVVEDGNERVLAKETRYLHDGEVTMGSSQIFMINQGEISVLMDMIKKHFM